MGDEHNTTPPDDTYDNFDGDTHFSDEELEAALADFEQEFRDEASSNAADSDNVGDAAPADGVAAGDTANGATDGGMDAGRDGSAEPTAAEGAEAVLDFDDELQGLLGNKAKVAVMITRLASADLLAAFCQLADVSATCVGHSDGAVAVLRNLDGDGPEAAARDLTTVVSGMPVILAVNRADKLEATLYVQGKPGQTFAPPILFSSTPSFVEDLMLGISDLDAVKAEGLPAVDSASLDHRAAMKVIARHTRFGGRGRSSIR